MRLHLQAVHCQHITTQLPSSNHLPSACHEHVCYPRSRRRGNGRETSKQCPLMMNIGIWKKSLIDLYVFTNIPYPHGLCPYPCPYVNYQTSSYYDTLDLSNISKFEDIMTTSSDEDLPSLEDIEY